MRFSVVIPVYNRASIVLKTLESVRSQTFEDFECLVIDDGSTDGDRLRQVVAGLDDDRFVYVRQDNGGANSARNNGIDRARGEFVAFLDSDDVWLPGKLANDDRVIYDEGVTYLFSQIIVDRGQSRHWISPRRGPRDDEHMAEYLFCDNGFTQTSTMVVERKLASYVRFRLGLPMGQDADFSIRLAHEGAKIRMREAGDVIWIDQNDPNRVSNMPPYAPMLAWSDELRPILGERAYHAFRGTHVSRLAAPTNRPLALRLLATAIRHGALTPRTLVKAAVQVCIPKTMYRRIFDAFVSRRGVTDAGAAGTRN